MEMPHYVFEVFLTQAPTLFHDNHTVSQELILHWQPSVSISDGVAFDWDCPESYEQILTTPKDIWSLMLMNQCIDPTLA